LVCDAAFDQHIANVEYRAIALNGEIMAGIVSINLANGSRAQAPATRDSPFVRRLLITIAMGFLTLFLVMPLAVIFAEALREGIGAYFASFNDPDALAAIKLTLLAAAIAVPMNVVFGLCAAWAITKFKFPGRSLLVTLIDLPFAVSP